jgi:hypothetical protein
MLKNVLDNTAKRSCINATIKILLLPLAVLTIVGCGSKPPAKPTGPLYSDNLTVLTYASSNPKKFKNIRMNYGAKVSQAMNGKNWYSSVNYRGDGQDSVGQKALLRITFIYTQISNGDFPVEAKVHHQLENDGQVSFNKVYQISINKLQASAICGKCNVEQALITQLERLAIPEIAASINKSK